MRSERTNKRLILPAEKLTNFEIPLYGTIPAGYPAEAYNYIEDRIDLNKYIIRHKSANFCMWATNRELLGNGIKYGDLLVFDNAIKQVKNAVGLYWIDGEYSLRRIVKTTSGMQLIAPNPAVPPLIVDEYEQVQCLGTLTHRLKKFSNYRHQYGNYPVDADRYIEKGMDYNTYYIGETGYEETFFYLRVNGESMTGDGIIKDDLLVVDRLAEGHDDSIYVFLVESSFTLKRIIPHKDYNLLVGSNPKFPAIRVEKHVNLHPWGVLVGTVTDYLKKQYEILYTL